jgi:hypothetical protein
MQHGVSPYVEDIASSIAGLSETEIDDLLMGRGMGLARTAELSSYPGPLHLLELQAELELSPQQVHRIEGIRQAMQHDAQALGEHIVAMERKLSEAFRSSTITRVELAQQTEALALLYGQLRAVHLTAHLEVTPLLSEQQIQTYDKLRGYTQ